MNGLNLTQFLARLALDPKKDTVGLAEKIVRFYSGRQYHNLIHIQECINAFNTMLLPTTFDEDLIKLAIILHDIIYVAARDDNEERSAALADEWMTQILDLQDPSDRDLVCVSIEMTKHSTKNYDILKKYGSNSILYLSARVVCDVDLAILAAPKERFEEYERQIREEYRQVPEDVFNIRRHQIIHELLERPTIYLTKHFYELFEKQARENLAKYQVLCG